MKIKRLKIIVLVGAILFQPTLVLGRTNEATHCCISEDHLVHEQRTRPDQNPVKYTVREYISTVRAHGDYDKQHNRISLFVMHDCSLGISGDIFHYQCGVTNQMSAVSIVTLSYSVKNMPALRLHALDGYNTSIFRPPITA